MKTYILLINLFLFLSFYSCKSEPPTEKYVKKAEEINSGLPRNLSPRLRLDKAQAISKNKFKFYYTLLGNTDMTESAFIKESGFQIIEKLKNNPRFREFKKDNMTIIYSYSRNDGSVFVEIEISPQEY